MMYAGGNAYIIYYVDSDNPDHMKKLSGRDDAIEITRARAEELCDEEEERRAEDRASSGYAPTEIYPITHYYAGEYEDRLRPDDYDAYGRIMVSRK